MVCDREVGRFDKLWWRVGWTYKALRQWVGDDSLPLVIGGMPQQER